MLNKNIKNLRKQKGYTQETFAQELNVVRQTVSKWEKGYSVPDAVMLEKMADLFDVSVSELLGGGEEKTEQKSDDKNGLIQISEQLSILNNQFAKELARKRRNRKIALIVFLVLSAVMLLFLVWGFSSRQFAVADDTNNDDIYYVYDDIYCVTYEDIDSKLNKAVSDVIISNNAGSYMTGEFKAESHFVFDVKEKDRVVTVYLIEEYYEFAFHNGFFTEISGGSTPAVFTFNRIGDKYEFINSEYPLDGELYASSINEMFPYRIAKSIIRGLSDEDNERMWLNMVQQAQKYLESIGRDATVCRFGEIKTEPLLDYGISVDVSNIICDMSGDYDFNVGNYEKIENGKRFVYQTDYDKQNNLITFTKFEYETNNIVEFIAVDGATGDAVKNAPKPEKVQYFKGELLPESR